jgi:hypothetical protein
MATAKKKDLKKKLCKKSKIIYTKTGVSQAKITAKKLSRTKKTFRVSLFTQV